MIKSEGRGVSAQSRSSAFSLIELLIVISIIIVLAGLVIGVAGYAQKKAARSRGEAEVLAMSAALEGYKADNGIYPDSTGLDARRDLYPGAADKAKYETASALLYVALTGDTNKNRAIDATETGKAYMAFKPSMLSPSDQWSTSGDIDTSETATSYMARWVKNW